MTLFLPAIRPEAHGGEAPHGAAWREAAQLLNRDALQKFQDGPHTREARLGEALTMLNVQPKTDGSVERAAGILRELSEEADDPYGILARYYLGRIEQIHRAKPDWEKAAAIYRDLHTAHPEHPIAQIGAVKYGILRLSERVPSAVLSSRVAEIERLAGSLDFPAARRDLNLALAQVYLTIFRSDEKALEHLMVAESIGIARLKNRADVWVRIGDLAASLGQREVALQYFQKFVERFQRDSRTYTIGERIRELQQGAP